MSIALVGFGCRTSGFRATSGRGPRGWRDDGRVVRNSGGEWRWHCVDAEGCRAPRELCEAQCWIRWRVPRRSGNVEVWCGQWRLLRRWMGSAGVAMFSVVQQRVLEAQVVGPVEMAVKEPLYGANRYAKGPTLGEGTYGVVFKAVDRVTNRTLAVKKIRLGKYKEGVNVTALREIKLLKELHDPNIIELVDVYPHKRNLHLVFEFMESDLEAVIRDRNIFLSPADCKSYMQMTLKGLAVCHKKWILHRDLKPNNLLLGSNGQLKLADFGLARIFGSPNRRFTHQVFARWYRAPELLFGSKQYGPGVDVWAAACIFAELILRRPFLQGSSDIDQLGKIFAAFGTPGEAQWPDMTSLPDYVEYQYSPPQSFRSLFPQASEDCLDLLQRMFTYDPKKRITAQQALEHRYFRTEPAPTPPHMLRRPAKPEAQPKPIELLSPAGPIGLSPPTKTRRIQLFTGDMKIAGEANRDANGRQHQPELGTPIDAITIPMSIDPKTSLRPTLNSTDRSFLKRKLDMDIFLTPARR